MQSEDLKMMLKKKKKKKRARGDWWLRLAVKESDAEKPKLPLIPDWSERNWLGTGLHWPHRLNRQHCWNRQRQTERRQRDDSSSRTFKWGQSEPLWLHWDYRWLFATVRSLAVFSTTTLRDQRGGKWKVAKRNIPSQVTFESEREWER